MELNHWGPLVSPLVTTKKSHVERPKRILSCVTVHKTGLENVQETALKEVLPWFTMVCLKFKNMASIDPVYN